VTLDFTPLESEADLQLPKNLEDTLCRLIDTPSAGLEKHLEEFLRLLTIYKNFFGGLVTKSLEENDSLSKEFKEFADKAESAW
jgi:hypothetical protein